MNWTREQSEAINIRDKNILVAAAAGSGKTAVLVERIRKLVCEENVPVGSLLVVTFTKAAASEMKEKIRKSLTKELESAQISSAEALAEDKENTEKIQYIKKQLADLPQADICTFHAFALTVIRRFFYLIDMEPGFSICDEVKSTLLQEDAMDELIEEEFEVFSDDFKAFMDAQSSDRNPNKIRELIFKMHTHLMAMPYPQKWMQDVMKKVNVNKDEFGKSDIWREYLAYISETLDDACRGFNAAVNTLELAGLTRMAQLVEQNEFVPVDNARKRLLTLKETEINPGELADELSACIEPGKIQLRATKEEKESYDTVKNSIKDLRESSKELVKELKAELNGSMILEKLGDINATLPYLQTLFRLTDSFGRKYSEAKASKRVIDFNDIEHRCLEVLQHDEARNYFFNKFSQIFIDEYQDTNIIQEEIISKIKRSNNVFMVGDVKQSIYSFRLAEPQIFEDKYRSFSDAGDGDSMAIDLNKNYRSKSQILDYINVIFKPLMRAYDDRAALYPGLEYTGEFNYAPRLHIVALDLAKQEDETGKAIQKLKKTEAEAKYISKLINEKLGTPFFDSKLGQVRPLKKSDIVILMRGVKSRGNTFKDILRSDGIECFVNESEGYFNTIEIEIFMSLLSVIDNMQQDIPLINVLHSEIFSFSAEELAEIRANCGKGPFYGALKTFAKDGEDERLKRKTANAVETLEKWKLHARIMPLSEFIWMLMIESGYYLIIGTQPAGVQKQANLRALVEYADKFAEDNQSSLYGFVRYVNSLKKRDVKMSEVKLLGESDDVVKIMTIHKSKGLEFPMVIVCGIGGKLNYSSAEELTVHKDLGVGISLKSLQGHWKKRTLLQKLINRKIKQKEIEEEERVLYVALTRARDLLYLVGTVDSEKTYLSKKESVVRKNTSYLDMIAPYTEAKLIAPDLTPGKSPVKKAVLLGNDERGALNSEEIPAQRKTDIEARLDYVYPFEKATTIKSKYSVSEINDKNEEAGAYVRRKNSTRSPKLLQSSPDTCKKSGILSAAQKGSIYHKIMENLDFDEAKKNGYIYVEKVANDCVAKNFFSEEELEQIDLKKICGFFDTELGKRCADASGEKNLFKEKPFTLKMSDEGDTFLVQGIIDCYFREKGKTVLIDYKSSYISEDNPEDDESKVIDRYKTQLSIYKMALQAAGEDSVDEVYIYLLSNGRYIGVDV
ncbi:MAG: helicase-exonuclease AddAB subunit AddA [Eubacterium sp.]|nr:helicase-exonuclease AddAB subunit AddA [Eubacterium sp.]